MDNVCMISDSFAFYGPGTNTLSLFSGYPIYTTAPGYSNYRIVKIANIRTGTVLREIFDSTQTHGTAFPVGPDYIVYQTQTALEWVNWHDRVAVAQMVPAKKTGSSGNARINVTGNRITIDLVLDEKTSPQLSLFTLKGELLGRISLGQLAAGSHHLEIPPSELAMVKRPGKTLILSVLKAGAATVAKRVIW